MSLEKNLIFDDDFIFVMSDWMKYTVESTEIS